MAASETGKKNGQGLLHLRGPITLRGRLERRSFLTGLTGMSGDYPKSRMQPPEGASARALVFISVTQAQTYMLKTQSLSQQPMRSVLPIYR